MDKKIRYIKNDRTRNGFDDDLILNSDDAMLFDTIGDYMKGKSDLEDVQNDPEYLIASAVVKDMVSFYNNAATNKENEAFIRRNFAPQEKESTLTNEIANIRLEINENKLNDITSEWVREWHEKKQKITVPDPKTEEIRSFISEAINSRVAHAELTPVNENATVENFKSQNINAASIEVKTNVAAESKEEKSSGNKIRYHLIRYTSLAAAALIGVFILVRTLLPVSDPGKLFDTNYKPFDAMSTVTRGTDNSQTQGYSNSIEKYKSGDYQTAALGFAAVLKNNPSSIQAQFFMGLTQLALKNYDQAENLLSGVADNAGEYGKEANWYLGLTYLETGNTQKAEKSFEYLANSKGFYAERSEKILRRLR